MDGAAEHAARQFGRSTTPNGTATRVLETRYHRLAAPTTKNGPDRSSPQAAGQAVVGDRG